MMRSIACVLESASCGVVRWWKLFGVDVNFERAGILSGMEKLNALRWFSTFYR